MKPLIVLIGCVFAFSVTINAVTIARCPVAAHTQCLRDRFHFKNAFIKSVFYWCGEYNFSFFQ